MIQTLKYLKFPTHTRLTESKDSEVLYEKKEDEVVKTAFLNDSKLKVKKALSGIT
jgi:hypothetical protein